MRGSSCGNNPGAFGNNVGALGNDIGVSGDNRGVHGSNLGVHGNDVDEMTIGIPQKRHKSAIDRNLHPKVKSTD